MNILLVQVDGTRPNLALMKFSSYHKGRGDIVALSKVKKFSWGLIPFKPDRAYISCIFPKNGTLARQIGIMLSRSGAEWVIGGSGVDLSKTLPEEIEHMRPDYDLYGIEYSIGFTSRGCHRSCPWCIVPKKEGMIQEHAPIDEFYVPRWKKLILYDNNFLASLRWAEKLHELIARKIKVSFNQGLDIRLVDQEVAKLLHKIHYYDDNFKKRRLYFSFDLPEIEPKVIQGIERLKKADIKPHHLMFYVLVGYNTTFEQDYHRFELLDKLGVKPFIMVYNNRKDKPILRHFARWVNKRYYKVCKFEDYKPAQKVLAHAT